MIIEHALLPVRSGQEADFEQALERALPHISGSSGFRRLSVSRGVETPGHYLLLVEWDTLADHTEGFRQSPAYDRWKAALHHFYDPFPDVQHFSPVVSVGGPA